MSKRAFHTPPDTGIGEDAIVAVRAAPSTMPAIAPAAAIAAPKMPFTLFRRDGSGAWQVRFSAGGVQVRRSLGTADRVEAERLALRAYAEALHRAKLGLRSRAKAFHQVAEEFVAQLRREAERGERRRFQADQWRRIVERYFVGFFADRPMDGIAGADVHRYAEWRKDYWTAGPGRDVRIIPYMRGGRQIRRPVTDKMRHPPSPSALRSEFVVLRLLFRFAANQGHINTAQIPEIRLVRVPANARPSFEAHEFAKLDRVSQERIADPAVNGHVRRDRIVLHAYCMIAAYTGCRPTELLRNLHWGDVIGYRECRDLPIGGRDIRLRVRGKGKSRVFVPLLAAIPWFDRLWEFWIKDTGREPADSDPVFATHTGRRLGSVKKGLSELLRAAGLLADHRGARRTAYSFRHFHISQQLIAGVDVFLLAKNTGTSSDMIERFYGQVKLERMAKELRPEWRVALSIET